MVIICGQDECLNTKVEEIYRRILTTKKWDPRLEQDPDPHTTPNPDSRRETPADRSGLC